VILRLDVDKIDPMPIRSDKNDFLPSGLWFTSAHIAVASYSKEAVNDTIFLSADCGDVLTVVEI
jgi:hypothetical protein